jgi:drug/metabolite transporter (DMT)-like permease
MTLKSRAGLLPVLAILAGAVIGASSGLYIKGLAFSSLAMSALRMSVPLFAVLPRTARHGLLLGKPGMRRLLFLTSALNAGRMYLFILADKLTAMSNAVVLLYLWPVFALLIDSASAKKRLSGAKFGVLFLATGGVVVMNLHRGFSLSGPDLLGSACMIVSAFVYAGTNVVYKQALSVMDESDVIYFQNGVGGIVFLAFLIAEIPGIPIAQLGIGIFYGFTVGFIGFGLFFYGMKRLPLFQYSALSYSEIPFGVFLGIAFRGETMTLNQAAGIVLIVAGSVLAQRLRTAKES